MSRSDRYSQLASQTAEQAKKTAEKKKQRAKHRKAVQSMNIADHRHCSVCWKPIPLDSDPAICDSTDCEEKQKKRESSRKWLTVMMYALPAFAILMLVMEFARA